VELTILMPCLNEAETLGACVRKARGFLDAYGVVGEVLVADNGSTDGSPAIAAAAGARVVTVPERGYGSALRAGTLAAQGRFVIMGDADDSYDFTSLAPFLERLRAGSDLVMGNRFRGGIEPGAMPVLHRYLGNPVLSFVGRLFFPSHIGDFHCGLRGYRRDAVLALGLQTTGMEYASEMVVRATLAGLDVTEVPTTLSPDGRSRAPHLRSWRDGWRHLRFLLLYSPRWLFFYPGLTLMALGVVVGSAVAIQPVGILHATLDVDTLVAAAAAVTLGLQAVVFAVLAKVYAINEGFLSPDPRIDRFLRWATLERSILLGLLLTTLGLAGMLAALSHWQVTGFGHLNTRSELRIVVPSVTAIVVGAEVVFGSLFVSILGIRHRAPAPLSSVEARHPAGMS